VPFFGRGGQYDPAELSSGSDGVPTAAEQRLAELTSGELFTSTLGVGEFALLSMLGPTPIAQVMGASVHQVGWQYLPPSAQWGGEVFCPLSAVMQAWDDARRRAFARMTEEARSVGADAVVGVTLKRGDHDWARGSVDYVVSGTAIRAQATATATATVTATATATASTPPAPVLSDLSVQDYWKLANAGWAPAGLLAATSVFFVAQSIRTQWRRRARVASNQELNEYSRGFSEARKTAVSALHGQAQRAGADGVVGVQFDHDVSRAKLEVAKYGYGYQSGYRSSGVSPTTLALGVQPANQGRDSRSGIVVTIQAVGTAIRRRQRVQMSAPQAVMRVGMPV
jgi:uncharacterized protein YbjQ (UPF0145 family)